MTRSEAARFAFGSAAAELITVLLEQVGAEQPEIAQAVMRQVMEGGFVSLHVNTSPATRVLYTTLSVTDKAGAVTELMAID